MTLLVLIVAGCSGGGCSSGCACGGITPLPNGFTSANRIENAGSVRLTQDGLTFIQNNLGPLATKLLGGMGQGGVITFAIPKSSGSLGGIINYDICKNGPNPNGNPPTCTAEINIGGAKLAIEPIAPHTLHVHGPIPIRLQDLPVDTALGAVHVVLDNGGSCPGAGAPYANINVDINVDVAVDQNMAHTARYGYTKLGVKLTIDQNQLQNSLGFCNGGILGGLLGALKGIVFNALAGPLLDTLTSQIDQQLCLKANPDLSPTCPSGLNDVNGVCRYGTKDTDECAAILLGTDGHIDLGGLLASISPGTKGGLDFVFAGGGPSMRDDNSGYSWGDLNPVASGVTLGMYGGAEPNPLSKCVKISDMKLPTGIPIPTELLGNTVSDWPAATPGPHVGIALSERFANYALNGVYNSGLLCLGISTENIALLNSGTLGLLASSSKDLGIQRETQQVALVVRPSQPPTITFGNGTDIKTDPLLRVKLNQAAFDFYFFSLDRYIRFMTATFDLDVPVNLTVTPKGLTPVIQTIGVSNGKVTNNGLLRESPTNLAAALGDLIASQVGQAVGGGISPIDLNSSLSSLGLKLIIPDTVDGKGSPGLRKLTKGSDNYLGIFAALDVAGSPLVDPVDTEIELVGKKVDPKGLRILTINPENVPVVSLRFGSSSDNGARAMEYQYRIDTGFWHPFTRERAIDVRDDWMRMQGKHVIQARARVVGEPMSLDPEPATVEVVVDIDPPAIKVGKVADGKIALTVKDAVSEDRSMVRVKLDQGQFTSWMPATQIKTIDVGDAAEITIEAKDEEGNVASTTEELIRGRADAPAGCGCAVVGADQTSGASLFALGAALTGVFARLMANRRRRQQQAAAPAAPVAAPPAREIAAKRSFGGHFIGGVALIALASTWSGCSCGSDTHATGASGAASSSGGDECPSCVTLSPGLIGEYTSVAVAGSTLWVAGYSEADYDNGNSWGDLVVGKWDGTKVTWDQADGVPTDPPVDPKSYNVKGFRHGQTDPGEDVGTWTSIAVDAAGNPAVAYYDRTNHALKFAQSDGKAWTVSTVDGGKPATDVGRYAKLLAVSGKFVIAYQSIEGGGDKGALISKVRVATSTTATPSASDWSFEDAAVDKTSPCRASFCADGTACLADTKLCAATLPDAMCMPTCASGSACIDTGGGKAGCATLIDANKIDSYPDAIGDYISMALDPKGNIGIAYYDRPHGNLMVASKSSGNWATTLVDGADSMGNDTGDMGIGASLFIDTKGDWHITYVDGLAEAVRYVSLTGGTTVNPPEVVDDGSAVDGVPFDDGQHIVGDDSHVVVTSAGEVRVTFQDATVGQLHYAVGTPSASGHTWTVKAPKQDGFAGAFSNIVEVDGKLQLVNWWRKGGEAVVGDVAVISPP